MEQAEWIVINYTLPREPSRIRVSIWRKLKKIGAVNIQQSMWILPQSDEFYEILNNIKEEIFRNNGEAFVMKSIVDEIGRNVIVEKFISARDEEYKEFLEKCDDFFNEINKETARENFSFAEIEENEEELNKLKQWFAKITARDFFGASLMEKSQAMLLRCEELLEGFSSKAYDFNDEK